MRPPRESYVRATVEAHGYTLEPAVEWRTGDCFEHVVETLRILAIESAKLEFSDLMRTATYCGDAIRTRYEGRAYFVEAWQDGECGFAQVYQPWGVPVNEPHR